MERYAVLLDGFIYRRVAPPLYKIKLNEVTPSAFAPGVNERGLSVFKADRATPREVLEARIESERARLRSDDPGIRERAAQWLAKNQSVEVLYEKQYRIVRFRISDIVAMGFQLEEPDRSGHLNLLGNRSLFETQGRYFIELIKCGSAVILSKEDTLAERRL